MRTLFINMLRATLRKLAQLTIWRYRPGIIGVTGTVGKTSTKLAIKTVLQKERSVRVSSGNLNNDLGLPLTILGDWSVSDLRLISREQPAGTAQFAKLFFWLRVIFTSAWHIAVRTEEYPEIIILEYGADRPGDIKYLLTIARPNISIITAVGDIPVHVEYYAGPEEVAREKGRLIEYLPVGGFAILNGDDETVRDLQARTRARVMTYGFAKGSEIRISRFENRTKDGLPVGISFRLEQGSAIVPVRITGAFGRSQAYAGAAAAAVGVVFGMNLVTISEALAEYIPAPARMDLVPGMKQTFIIDDSYNASPLSMHAALDTLHDLPAKRKIAVLGDMLEIGKYTLEAHEKVGQLAAKSANVIFTVGPRAKFIADAAKAGGMRKANIFSYETTGEVLQPLREFIKKGDLILIKGSHAMDLEKAVDEIRYESTPES